MVERCLLDLQGPDLIDNGGGLECAGIQPQMVKALAVDRKNDVQLAITGLDHRGVIESVGLILVEYGRCFPVTTVFAEGEVHAIGLPPTVAVDHGKTSVFQADGVKRCVGVGKRAALHGLPALASIVTPQLGHVTLLGATQHLNVFIVVNQYGRVGCTIFRGRVEGLGFVPTPPFTKRGGRSSRDSGKRLLLGHQP